MNEAEELTGLTDEELRLGGYKIYTTLSTQAQVAIDTQFENDANFEASPDDQRAQGAMVILDHRTGAIQGMSAGRDYVRKGLNRVKVTRQPGSTFKPLVVYGPAVETGNWNQWSMVRDELRCYNGYCPSDINTDKFIGEITMTRSVQESRNASAVWLLNEIGISVGVQFAQRAGITTLTPEDQNLALALGGLSQGVTPLELAKAYGAFANGGMRVDPHTITKLVDASGQEVYSYVAPKAARVMQADTAAQMSAMLKAVMQEGGTGTQGNIDRPVAGKTGTTQSGIDGVSGNRDVWFAGYTGQWTGVVWMGYDRTDQTHILHKSSNQAARLFAKVMQPAMAGMPVESLYGSGTQAAPPMPPVEEEPAPLAVGPVGELKARYNPSAGKVELGWRGVEAAEGQTIAYDVYRAQGTAGEALITTTDNTQAEDIDILPAATYSYYVTAYDVVSGAYGAPSETVTVMIPGTGVGTPAGENPAQQPEFPPREAIPEEEGDAPDEGSGVDPGSAEGDAGEGAEEAQDPPAESGEWPPPWVMP
jgi:penicillin-binding protein 2A